jgi:tetratricopeptide (TPR) repeat protein
MSAPAGVELPDIQVTDAREVDIVEAVLTHRAMYHKSLTALNEYYRERGYHNKRQWAEAELADLNRVKPYKYILSAEIPDSSLRPRDSIDEADRMYERGLVLMKEGGHGVPVFFRQDKMREALVVFTDLISKYPSSDKIDDAAYQCGVIHKEYFKDDEQIAVQWYERACEWDPNTPHAARFGAAVVYDYRLHDRDKALELYHRVLEEEAQFESNAMFASRRIHELSEGRNELPEPTQRNRDGRHASPGEAPANEVDGSTEPVAAETLVPIVDLSQESYE